MNTPQRVHGKHGPRSTALLPIGVALALINAAWITMLAISDLVLLESSSYPRTMMGLLGLVIVASVLWLFRLRLLSNIVSSVQIAISGILLAIVTGLVPGDLLSLAY